MNDGDRADGTDGEQRAEPFVVPEGMEMPTRDEYFVELAEERRIEVLRSMPSEPSRDEKLRLAHLEATLATYYLLKGRQG